jgi:hypothetical protein
MNKETKIYASGNKIEHHKEQKNWKRILKNKRNKIFLIKTNNYKSRNKIKTSLGTKKQGTKNYEYNFLK